MSSRCKWCGEPEASPVLVDKTGPLTLYRQRQNGGYVMVDADKIVRVALELEDGGYVVVNSDEVVRVALELQGPTELAKVAIVAIHAGRTEAGVIALYELRDWICGLIEEYL